MAASTKKPTNKWRSAVRRQLRIWLWELDAEGAIEVRKIPSCRLPLLIGVHLAAANRWDGYVQIVLDGTHMHILLSVSCGTPIMPLGKHGHFTVDLNNPEADQAFKSAFTKVAATRRAVSQRWHASRGR